MEYLKCFFQLSFCSLIVFSTTSIAQSNSASKQQELPQLPQAVQEIYPAVYQGKIWVAGGISSHLPQSQGQMTDQVQFWSPGMQQWQKSVPLPEGRHHTYLQAVTLKTGNEKLFAFGGFINSDTNNSEQGQWKNTADVLLLDIKNGHWKKVAQMPAPLSETVAAVIDGKIHLAGGRSSKENKNSQWQHSTDVNWHWVFDPVTYEVTQAAPLPSARNSAATVQLKNRWIVIGGRTVGGKNLTEVLEYDAKQNRWINLPAMPEGRAGHAAAVLGNHIQIFGGEHDTSIYTPVLQFDLRKNQWQTIGNWQTARHGLGAVNLDGKIWLIGGATDAGLKNTKANLDAAADVIQ